VKIPGFSPSGEGEANRTSPVKGKMKYPAFAIEGR
jgi:hypothetical protein